MGIYRALGSALVTESEYRERLADGSIRQFHEESTRNKSGAKLEFSSGAMLLEDVAPVGFTPIGVGKPLTVRIRTVYTGRYPDGFHKTRDVLVISAMKGMEVYSASPRAVNYLRKDVGRNTTMAPPAATEEGTPLVFYSPALTQTESVVSFEIVFDKFPQDVFNKVGSAFQALAGVPAFTPYGGIVLVAAGLLSRLIGKIGEASLDGAPSFRATESIVFALPGAAPAVADFRLVTDDSADPFPVMEYELRAGRVVRKGTTDEYKGEIPYMVISLDGAVNDKYSNFLPTAATAAILERFYRRQSSGEVALDAFVEAVKVYSDVKFRRKAEGLKREIAVLPAGDLKQKKTDEYNALVKNILSEELKIQELQ